ncbi:hypothetical protein CUTER_09580 [Corynebacterium uterequi]|uniref:Uncharacterized protein n=1 Tax=Corynebacterium uterequi TaxID=1072256 RepID=A0A0G3HF03_9CORY|nr:hypothetical protein CUTER_09580 [Corynebacterium uterequi]
MSLGRKILLISLGSNIAFLCLVSAIVELVAFPEIPWWIAIGNVVVFLACSYIVFTTIASLPAEP